MSAEQTSPPWRWEADPLARTLEASALREGAWVLLGAFSEDAEVRVAPLEAVALALGALWR